MLEDLFSLLEGVELERKESEKRIKYLERCDYSEQVHQLNYYFLELIRLPGVQIIPCNGKDYHFSQKKRYFNMVSTSEMIMTIHVEPEEFFIATKPDFYHDMPDWRSSVPDWIYAMQSQIAHHELFANIITRDMDRSSFLNFFKEAKNLASRLDQNVTAKISVTPEDRQGLVWDKDFPFQDILLTFPKLEIITSSRSVANDFFSDINKFLDSFSKRTRISNLKANATYSKKIKSYIFGSQPAVEFGFLGYLTRPHLHQIKIPYDTLAYTIEEELRNQVFKLYDEIYQQEHKRIKSII